MNTVDTEGKVDTEVRKHCVAFGDLDGARFTRGIANLRTELGRLETFVRDLSDELDVAPAPMHSIGWEVDRDVVVIDHLEEGLADAVSQVIDLMAMTRMARARLESAT